MILQGFLQGREFQKTSKTFEKESVTQQGEEEQLLKTYRSKEQMKIFQIQKGLW